MKTLLLFLTLFTSSPIWAATNSPQTHFFDQTFGDFTEELETAKAQGKKAIFIFFEMEECPFCHRMKTTILNQPQVQTFFKQHFLNFSIDIEGDIEITDFKGKTLTQKQFAFQQYRVRATPVMAFFDLNGNLIFKHTGPVKNVDNFLLLGQYIANGVYKKMRFIPYKRQQHKRQ